MVASSELPQEILIDIFSRLPSKSVGKCRCLSKAWRNILSSPQFIKSHLNRKTHHESLLLRDHFYSIHSIPTIKDGARSREVDFPFGCTEMVGSCDGLVLIVDDCYDKFLLNPVTLEKVIVPNNPLALTSYGPEIIILHGFGYDNSIDDYKIVTLSYFDASEDSDNEWDSEETFVDVYFAKRGVWKRVDSCSPYNHGFPYPHSGAFLNGAIHWLAMTRGSSERLVLVAFDLYNEVFTEIPTPDGTTYFCRVVVLGGCLCIVDVRYGSRRDVWMMKEYGLVESWTKLIIDTVGELGSWRPLCFVGDQEILLVATGQTSRVYNMKKGTLRDMIVDEVPADFEDGVTFVPSLVSPVPRIEILTNFHDGVQFLYDVGPQFHEHIHRELGRLTAQYAPDDLGHLSIPKHVWRQVYDLCAPFRAASKS